MEDKRKEIVGNVIRIQRYHSPCGDLMLGSFEDRLCLCDWAVESHRDIVDRRLRKVLKACYEESTSEVIQKAIKQLDEYFNGERTAFEVPLLFVGTDFQKSVWYKLLDIPYGSTVSYGELAKQLDMSVRLPLLTARTLFLFLLRVIVLSAVTTRLWGMAVVFLLKNGYWIWK